jgi:polyadenylate-binding protein
MESPSVDQQPPATTMTEGQPESHPYVHEPLLYISNVPPYVSDENLARAFQHCAPFRPRINRDGGDQPFSGTIEFKFLEKGRLNFFVFLETVC